MSEDLVTSNYRAKTADSLIFYKKVPVGSDWKYKFSGIVNFRVLIYPLNTSEHEHYVKIRIEYERHWDPHDVQSLTRPKHKLKYKTVEYVGPFKIAQ